MILKKIASLAAAAVLAAALLLPAGAADAPRPIMAALDEESPAPPTAYYTPISGKVVEIGEPGDSANKFIRAEDANGEPFDVILTPDTLLFGDSPAEEGDELTAWFETDAPRIMIWPAQYHAVVAAFNYDEWNIKADLFDEALVSRDGQLKLIVSEGTEVVLPDGTAFDGVLAGQKLCVLYGASTKSIPAQTTPEKIVVITEPEALLPKLIVEGQPVSGPAAYTDRHGVVMVPLRAVAEALGYEVGWDGGARLVSLDGVDVIAIGNSTYATPAGSEVVLDTAPEIRNDSTYVPLEFFRAVLGLNNAYLLEGQIVIDNGEKME